MFLKKLKSKTGFSMIEVSIVMGVVSIGLLGVVSLVMQNIQVQRNNRNVLVASMLAQEGIELVRSVRDDNWIAFPIVDWDLDIAGYTSNDFIIDNTSAPGLISLDDENDDVDVPVDITDIPGARLYLDANNFYTHDDNGGANTPTQYYRLLTATPGGDVNVPLDGINDYYKIKSHVQWQDRGDLKDYIAETYLYDWR